MIVTPVDVVLSLPFHGVRGSGIHLSGVIRCIAAETGILKPEWVDDLSLDDSKEITDPEAILRMAIGMAWEEWYVKTQLPEVMPHPGELCVEGIFMNPDGLSVSVIITEKSGDLLVVHEIKTTSKSVKTVGEDLASQSNWMWLTQIKGYCKGYDTVHAMLHVLFIHGDYKYPIKPMKKIWRIEFTQTEIDTSWKLIQDYKLHRQEK